MKIRTLFLRLRAVTLPWLITLLSATCALHRVHSEDCCGGSSSNELCEVGSCPPGFAVIKITWSPPTSDIPPGQIWHWKFSIRAESVDSLEGWSDVKGDFFSDGTVQVDGDAFPVTNQTGKVCGPVGATYSITITPDPDNGSTLGMPADVEGVSATPSDPAHNDPPTGSEPTSSGTYPCLMSFKWCGSCAGKGNHCATEEKRSQFTIDPSDDATPVGDSSSSINSLHFRINLGKASADEQSSTLVLREENITAASFLPSRLKVNNVVNRYKLEIWHWMLYTRLPSSESGSGQITYFQSGRHFEYPFYGDVGFKEVFKNLNVDPLPRTKDILQPQPNLGDDIHLVHSHETTTPVPGGADKDALFDLWVPGLDAAAFEGDCVCQHGANNTFASKWAIGSSQSHGVDEWK